MTETVRKLSLLNEIGRALTSVHEPDCLLDEILKAMEDVFDLANCAVLLQDLDTGELRVRRSRGYDPEIVNTLRVPSGQGITGWVLDHNQPVLVDDVRNDPRYIPGLQDAVSEMAAPLRMNSRVLGVLDAESATPGAFSAQDLELFSAFAAHAAVCLHNATLHLQLASDQEALRRTAERQRNLAQATALLQADLDVDVLLAKILELCQSALGFEACAVLLAKDDQLVFAGGRGYPGELRGSTTSMNQGITGAVARSRKPLLVPDVQADSRYNTGIIRGRCEMTVPLLVGDQLLGVLDAESMQVAAHDEEDLELFSIFAAHAAMAIRNSRQVAELAQREKQLSQKVRELALLSKTGEEICGLLDLDEVLTRTLTLASEALPFTRCAVLLLDSSGQRLVVRSAYGYRAEVTGLEFPLDRGVTGRVARSGEATLVADVSNNGDYILGVEGGCSEMAVPLMAQGQLIGVLDAEAMEPGAFSEREFELFKAFGSWVAIALHNARLYRRVEQSNKQLVHNLAEIENMNLELNAYSERISEANRELEHRVQALVTLHEASKTITSSLDLDETLKTIETLSTEIVNATSGVIRLIDSEAEYFTGPSDAAVTTQPGKHVMETPLRIGDRTIGIFELAGDEGFNDEDRRMIQTLASQAAIAIENARLFERTQRLYYQTIRSLAGALEARDSYTSGHSERVTKYSVNLAEAIGLDSEEQRLIESAALLHDIGKIGISDMVLLKTDKLDEDDRVAIQQHPLYGDTILEPLRYMKNVQGLVRHHHERWDGNGYPDGLTAEEIPLAARIVAVADAFDAMTSDRPYRPALSRAEAIAELRDQAGKQFDPELVEAFLKLLETEASPAGRQPE